MSCNYNDYNGKDKIITIFAQENSDPKTGADGINFASGIVEHYGWDLESE